MDLDPHFSGKLQLSTIPCLVNSSSCLSYRRTHPRTSCKCKSAPPAASEIPHNATKFPPKPVRRQRTLLSDTKHAHCTELSCTMHRCIPVHRLFPGSSAIRPSTLSAVNARIVPITLRKIYCYVAPTCMTVAGSCVSSTLSQKCVLYVFKLIITSAD